ncbi:hypothetical protein EMN47_04500 [Prolixibacteraceae bacterium JC049]|nr:hypothetical protein [Prolixibacteraceae bacterium JC049]
MAEYVLYNGNLYPRSELSLPLMSGLWESSYICERMRSAENRLYFLRDHLKQIRFYAEYSEFSLPSILDGDASRFEREVARMLNKNKYFKGAIVSAYFSHDDWLVTAQPISSRKFEFNSDGELIDIFEKVLKPVHLLSSFEPLSRIVWGYAQRFYFKKQQQNCIILNEERKVCEAVRQNLFVVKGKKLLTPPMNSGCYHDILREKILSIARVLEMEVEQNQMLNIQDLLRADEAFLASAADGITWLKGVRARRFYNRFTKQINDGLNDLLTGDLQ